MYCFGRFVRSSALLRMVVCAGNLNRGSRRVRIVPFLVCVCWWTGTGIEFPIGLKPVVSTQVSQRTDWRTPLGDLLVKLLCLQNACLHRNSRKLKRNSSTLQEGRTGLTLFWKRTQEMHLDTTRRETFACGNRCIYSQGVLLTLKFRTNVHIASRKCLTLDKFVDKLISF